jgi:predicted permease
MAARALFDRRRVELDMEKEMRLHLEMEIESYVAQGMSPPDATRAARIAFGGMQQTREAVRDQRATRLLDDLATDIRMSLRGMRNSPGFTFAVIALLGLGTGANSAIFSVVNRLILHPIPFAGGDRMVQLRVTAGGGEFLMTPTQQLVDDWRRRGRTIEEVLPSRYLIAAFGDTTRPPVKQLEGAAMVPGTMRFVGMRPTVGRGVIASDTLADAAPVAVLGYAFWKRQFGGRVDVIGSSILLNGRSHQVVGVAPRGFALPFSGGRDVFTALQAGPPTRWVDAVAKLKPGYTIEDASRELAAIPPSVPATLGVPIDPPKVVAGDDLYRSRRGVVLMLFAAVGLVLLIACANVANLLLSRAWMRHREFAVRGAMGASRGRLARQVVTESVLLAVFGGLLGILLSVAFLKLLLAAQPEAMMTGADIRVDGNVLAWTFGISALTGLLFSIAPVMMVTVTRISDVLKTSTRAASSGGAARKLRSGLVIFEVALSVVLLVGAGLLIRTLAAMQTADIGVNTHGLAALDLRLSGPDFSDATARRDVLAAVIQRVKATPGIDEATYVLVVPPEFGVSIGGVEIAGQVPRPADSLANISFNQTEPGFFRVSRLQFLEGRPFVADRGLSDQSQSPEIVINERFARRVWPDGGAIGARIRRGKTWATIVGVVRDVDVPGASGMRSPYQYYQSMPAAPARVSILARSKLPPAMVEPLLRSAVMETGSRVGIRNFIDVEARLAKGRALHRFILGLLGGFAMLAVVLTAIGMYAVISFSVNQRQREIGIRLALGAPNDSVAGMIFGHGMKLTVVGAAVGGAGAFYATKLMRGLLFGVEPGDPVTIASSLAVLCIIAVIACAAPARRATRVDPVELVRAE